MKLPELAFSVKRVLIIIHIFCKGKAEEPMNSTFKNMPISRSNCLLSTLSGRPDVWRPVRSGEKTVPCQSKRMLMGENRGCSPKIKGCWAMAQAPLAGSSWDFIILHLNTVFFFNFKKYLQRIFNMDKILGLPLLLIISWFPSLGVVYRYLF